MSQMSDESIETYLNEKQLAQKLRVSVGTLRLWRAEGKGPRFRKVGEQLVRYSAVDINHWLSRRPSGGEKTPEVAK
jgi:predicted DNA-binding transcriptional regulator AlpA